MYNYHKTNKNPSLPALYPFTSLPTPYPALQPKPPTFYTPHFSLPASYLHFSLPPYLLTLSAFTPSSPTAPS